MVSDEIIASDVATASDVVIVPSKVDSERQKPDYNSEAQRKSEQHNDERPSKYTLQQEIMLGKYRYFYDYRRRTRLSIDKIKIRYNETKSNG